MTGGYAEVNFEDQLTQKLVLKLSMFNVCGNIINRSRFIKTPLLQRVMPKPPQPFEKMDRSKLKINIAADEETSLVANQTVKYLKSSKH